MPQCLGDQHSIEGVTVMARQTSGTFGIGNADRERLKSLAGNVAGDVCSYDPGLGELANSVFSRDFPRGGGANHDVV